MPAFRLINRPGSRNIHPPVQALRLVEARVPPRRVDIRRHDARIAGNESNLLWDVSPMLRVATLPGIVQTSCVMPDA